MSKSCPYCLSRQRNRIKKEGFLRYIPRTSMYNCMKCNSKYYYNGLLHLSFKFKAPPLTDLDE